ncbi:MAG TPA: TMEM43 family protein [Bryobacteraceae bacterium]|nr:TMEM43 family protein [Bryobacteraceae bacterium]
MDGFTEVTTQGLGSRLLQSIKGVLLGLVLFVAGFPVLWFNEGYAVKTARSLSQGAHDVISVMPDRVDPANEGKLVHVAGLATTTETVADPLFKVSAQGIRLRRTVEMYQWKESSSSRKEKDVGGSETTRTTYRYAPVWSEQAIESAAFKRPEEHQNPAMPFRSADYVADRVMLGAFRLNGDQVARLTGGDPVDVSAAGLPDSIRGRAHPLESGFQIGDPASPKVGDLRITFSRLKPVEVSVVARQLGDRFEAYSAKAGGAIELVAMGVQSADAMFARAQTENVVRTWILRGVGLILMLIGLALVLNPLATFGDVVPFVGSLLRAGVGVLSFVVALCLSLLTIAVAWITFRPLVGVTLLAGAALLVYGTVRFRKRAAAKPKGLTAAAQ